MSKSLTETPKIPDPPADVEIMKRCILDAHRIDGELHNSEEWAELKDKYGWDEVHLIFNTWELAKILFDYRTDLSRIPTSRVIAVDHLPGKRRRKKSPSDSERDGYVIKRLEQAINGMSGIIPQRMTEVTRHSLEEALQVMKGELQ